MPDGERPPQPWWLYWNLFDKGRRRGQVDPLEAVRRRISRRLLEEGPELPPPPVAFREFTVEGQGYSREFPAISPEKLTETQRQQRLQAFAQAQAQAKAKAFMTGPEAKASIRHLQNIGALPTPPAAPSLLERAKQGFQLRPSLETLKAVGTLGRALVPEQLGGTMEPFTPEQLRQQAPWEQVLMASIGTPLTGVFPSLQQASAAFTPGAALPIRRAIGTALTKLPVPGAGEAALKVSGIPQVKGAAERANYAIDDVIRAVQKQVNEATNPLDKSFLRQQLTDLQRAKRAGRSSVPEEYFINKRTQEVELPPGLVRGEPVPAAAPEAAAPGAVTPRTRPRVTRPAAPVTEVRGKPVLEALGENLRLFRGNRAEQARFLRQQVKPALAKHFKVDPLDVGVDIWTPFPSGEPLLEATGVWGQRLQEMGAEAVKLPGSDVVRYRLPVSRGLPAPVTKPVPPAAGQVEGIRQPQIQPAEAITQQPAREIPKVTPPSQAVTPPIEPSAAPPPVQPPGGRKPIFTAGPRAIPLEPQVRPVTTQPGAAPPAGGLPSGRVPGGTGRQGPPPPPRDPYDNLLQALEPEKDPLLRKLRQGIPQEFYDRNFPLRELQRQTGIPARDAAQVVPGATTAGEDIVRRFYKPVLDALPERDMRFLEQYMVLRRMEDILTRNPAARLPGGIDGWGGIFKAQDTLRRKLGTVRYQQLETVAQDLWKLNDEQVLSAYVREGLISKEMRRDILSAHPHYIPFRRADFTEDIAQGFVSARPEASLSSTGIKKMGLEGSERALADPLMRLLQDPIKAQTNIFRNRAARTMVEALEEWQAKTGDDLVRYIHPKKTMQVAERVTGEALPRLKKGEHSRLWETISFFKDGEKHMVEVPAIYGRVAKGLGAEPDNIALRIGRALSNPLRYGATIWNPFFPPVNIIRDAMSAMFREKLFPFGPDYVAGLWAAIRKNSLFTEAAQSGALLSGIVENMTSRRALRNPLGGIQVRNPVDALLLPFRLIEEVNIVTERGVRLGTFRKLRAEGLDALAAAVRTRDATVDFAKSGHTMRVINQVVPFSNAAVQGGANMIRTIRDHPVRSLGFGMLFTVPTVMSRVNNMRFETSSLIPDWEYTRNWVIQFGEGTRKDGTKYPIYIKIPKGEIAAMFTFPAEALFSLARDNNDRSAVEMLLEQGMETFRTVSPVDPDIAGLGFFPPAAQTFAGAALGVDPFTRRSIVPLGEKLNYPGQQQFGPETGALAVALGQAFHISPRTIEFAINDYFAGVGQSANWLLGMGLEAAGFKPEHFAAPTKDFTERYQGTEAVSRVPGIRRFLGTFGFQEPGEAGGAAPGRRVPLRRFVPGAGGTGGGRSGGLDALLEGAR